MLHFDVINHKMPKISAYVLRQCQLYACRSIFTDTRTYNAVPLVHS